MLGIVFPTQDEEMQQQQKGRIIEKEEERYRAYRGTEEWPKKKERTHSVPEQNRSKKKWTKRLRGKIQNSRSVKLARKNAHGVSKLPEPATMTITMRFHARSAKKSSFEPCRQTRTHNKSQQTLIKQKHSQSKNANSNLQQHNNGRHQTH